MLLNKQKVLSKGQFRKRGDGKSPDEVIVKRLGIFVFFRYVKRVRFREEIWGFVCYKLCNIV